MNVSVDRLQDIQLNIHHRHIDELDIKEPTNIKEPLPSIEFEKFNHIQVHIDALKSVCISIDDSTDMLKKTVFEDKRQPIITRVNQLINDMNKKNMKIKNDLDQIKIYIEKESKPIMQKIIGNMYNMYVARVKEALDNFHMCVSRFRNILNDQSKRELTSICPNLSEEKITEIIDSGTARDVLQKTLGGENIEHIIVDIENNHMEILKLEKQVAEIYQLFCDLAMLVDIQQESLNIIDIRIQKSIDCVKSGSENLNVADKYSKSTRKRLCIIICCVIIVIIVMLVPILKSQALLF